MLETPTLHCSNCPETLLGLNQLHKYVAMQPTRGDKLYIYWLSLNTKKQISMS